MNKLARLISYIYVKSIALCRFFGISFNHDFHGRNWLHVQSMIYMRVCVLLIERHCKRTHDDNVMFMRFKQLMPCYCPSFRFFVCVRVR